jgi:hypothetical protein
MIRAVVLIALFVRVFMGAPLRIPTAKLLRPAASKVSRNAAIVVDTQFVEPGDVHVEIGAQSLAATIDVGAPFGPGVNFSRYLIVRPQNGTWPASAKLHLRIDGPTPPVSESVKTSDAVSSTAPRIPKLESPTLERGAVYSGEVYERTLLRVRHGAFDDRAGPIILVTLKLLDRKSGDVIDASGYVPTAAAGSLLLESDTLRCIAGGEIVDLAGNRTIIPKSADCGSTSH